MSRVIKTTMHVYTTEYSGIGPEDLRDMPDKELANSLQVVAYGDMKDWAKVGAAEVTITLFSTDEIITGQVESLREQAKQVQAEAQKKVTDIERQIQMLLAISYEPEAQA